MSHRWTDVHRRLSEQPGVGYCACSVNPSFSTHRVGLQGGVSLGPGFSMGQPVLASSVLGQQAVDRAGLGLEVGTLEVRAWTDY